MKSAEKARNNGLYRHIRTSKEIIRNLLNYYDKDKIAAIEQNGYMDSVTMLTKPPFDKPLSFTRLFDKKMQMEIMAAINKVKDNAVVIAT